MHDLWKEVLDFLKAAVDFFKVAIKVVLIVVAFVLAVCFALTLWDKADKSGYVAHHEPVDLCMSNNWLVGENRVCYLTTVKDANGNSTGKIDDLSCPVGQSPLELHNIALNLTGTCALTIWTATLIPFHICGLAPGVLTG